MADKFDLMEAVAGISGKTSFEVWESGNDWKTIVKNAESLLGAKQKKWNVIYDQSGNVAQIIGKNGKYVNFSGAVGEVQQYIAGNQLITDVVAEESGALTAYTGNIVSATGEVTKKGLALGANTGAKAVMGALGAFGAVATGVQWYKENPEFWTDLSQKLLPFAYKDPTNKAWSDIFYEALVPTAVDSDGNTYLPAPVLEQAYKSMYEQGLFTIVNKADIPEETQFPDTIPKYIQELRPTLRESIFFIYNGRPGREPQYFIEQLNYNATEGFFLLWNGDNNTGNNGVRFVLNNGGTEYNYKQSVNTSSYVSLAEVYLKSQQSELGQGRFKSSSLNGYDYYVAYEASVPDLISNEALQWLINSNNYTAVKTWLQYFTITRLPQKEINNITIPSYPTGDNLQTAFPSWYDDAVTTVNPDWKPIDGDDNKYVTWLPVQFPDDVTGDGGSTDPDTTPEEVRKGKPTPNDTTGKTTDDAIGDGVLPNPNPDPETQPSSGTSPDTPTPTPTEPQENKPYITGSASALWKIYNPSQAVLQQFGAWLWSSDPVKMIKELFSNNPADGIIGLHMIYVTPVVGGTSNIVVGYVDSGVASNYVSEQYVSLDCGSVTVPLRYQSALDYGYTKVYIYLPFIGIVPLDSFDIIGKTVHVKYTVDVLTGIVLAQVMVSLGSYEAVLYTFNGSCSVEYPLTSGSRSSQMLSLITGAVGGAVVGGAAGAVLGGARGALTGADIRMSGNLSGNAGAMGIRKPYIIVKRPVEVPALGYNSFYGYPANITGVLNSFNGYVRVKEVHVDDISGASADEKREIEGLLKAGVIIS